MYMDGARFSITYTGRQGCSPAKADSGASSFTDRRPALVPVFLSEPYIGRTFSRGAIAPGEPRDASRAGAARFPADVRGSDISSHRPGGSQADTLVLATKASIYEPDIFAVRHLLATPPNGRLALLPGISRGVQYRYGCGHSLLILFHLPLAFATHARMRRGCTHTAWAIAFRNI